MRSYGCAFNRDDLFKYFDMKKLELKKTKTLSKLSRVGQVWEEQFKMVLEDCINNNDTFILPLTNNMISEIHVDKIAGDNFKRARQKNMFQEIDFLKSNFTAYRLCFVMNRKNYIAKKPIYVSGELKQKLIDNTNNGIQYC